MIFNLKRSVVENSIGNMILKIGNNLSNYINKSFANLDIDINVQQLILLMILWQKDGQRQQNLADRSSKDKTSTARLIGNMEKKNLVDRRPDMNDNRQKLVFLTEKSIQLKYKVLSQLRTDLQGLEEGIDRKSLDICIQVLNKISHNLKKSTT